MLPQIEARFPWDANEPRRQGDEVIQGDFVVCVAVIRSA
jgi:hypothetical protein